MATCPATWSAACDNAVTHRFPLNSSSGSENECIMMTNSCSSKLNLDCTRCSCMLICCMLRSAGTCFSKYTCKAHAANIMKHNLGVEWNQRGIHGEPCSFILVTECMPARKLSQFKGPVPVCLQQAAAQRSQLIRRAIDCPLLLHSCSSGSDNQNLILFAGPSLLPWLLLALESDLLYVVFVFE